MAFRLAKPIFASASSSAVWGLQRRAVSHLLASRKGQQLPPQSPRRARLAQPGAVSPSRVLALAESYRDRVTHLKRLRVKDFVLIDDQLVTFGPGFNCITGPSGSGKTILAREVSSSVLLLQRSRDVYSLDDSRLNAIGQLCGENVLDDVFRQNVTNATIEGVWQLSGYHAGEVQKILHQGGPTKPAQGAAPDVEAEAAPVVNGESELVITREFTRSSSQDSRGTRTVCKVNGVQVKAKTLKAIGSCLVDLNGQGAAYTLQDAAAQLELVDERAGTLGEAERFASLLAELRDAERRVTDMASPPDEEEAAELQELLDAVNRVDVYQGEDDELRAQLKQIDLGRADAEAVARTARALGDGPGSAEMALGLAKRELYNLLQRYQRAKEDAKADDGGKAGKNTEDEEGEARAEQERLCSEAFDRIVECQEILQETQDAVERFASTLEATSPMTREEVMARLREIEKLAKRYSFRTASELCDAADEAEQRLATSDSSAKTREEMLEKIEKCRSELAELGVSLSQKRRAAARALEKEVESALASLKMDGTRFRVGFEWEEAEEGEGIQVDGDAVGEEGTEFEPTSAGFDRVSFLMSAGPRDPFRPLAQIASGGERGRIMLALKIAPVLTATPAAGAAATSAPVDSSFDASAAAANGEDASASDADAGAAPEGSAAAVVRNLSLAPGPPVSIFDEIDAGVSGDVGSSVGRALQRLARTGQQVLCITHLAQVASHADVHLRVSKEATSDGSRVTRISSLENDHDRATELSAMMDLGIAAGAEMLRAAELRTQNSGAPTLTEAMAAAAARQQARDSVTQ